MRESTYGFSKTEYEVMDMIWTENREMRFGEIMDYFVTVKKKKWKIQTLKTYLIRLVDKGTLKAKKVGHNCIYSPAISKEEYLQQWTHSFLDKTFQGSLRNFICAFTGNSKLSRQEVEELREFWEEET